MLCTPRCVLLTSLVLLEFFRVVLCMGSFFYVYYVYYSCVSTLCLHAFTGASVSLEGCLVVLLSLSTTEYMMAICSNMRMVRSFSLSRSWEVNSHTDSSCHSDVKCRAYAHTSYSYTTLLSLLSYRGGKRSCCRCVYTRIATGPI